MPIAASLRQSGSIANPRQLNFPRSLRGQFSLALWILALLSVAGGLASIYALRVSTAATQDLARERLTRMQQAQEIAQRTLLIDREADHLLVSASLAATRDSYTALVEQTSALDNAVQAMTAGGDDVAMVDLQQANQLFRNTVDVAVQLRESVLRAQDSLEGFLDERAMVFATQGGPGVVLANFLYRLEDTDNPAAVDQLRLKFNQRTSASAVALWRSRDPFAERLHLLEERSRLLKIRDQLTLQSRSLVSAARQQSASLDQAYRAAVEELVDQSRGQQHSVLLLLAVSLLFTWLISTAFRHLVLKRLQHVSHYLLLEGAAPTPLESIVRGRDEIGDMARAVDRFMIDRAKLALRTSELQETQDQLVKAARLAGIAEVATNILHNVGNVLNSINVSANIIGEKLRASKAGGLTRAVRLMDDHQGRLADFLEHDGKGEMLRAYLRDLGPTLEAEQEAISKELATLCRRVDHVKEIVAAQQSFANAPRVVEFVEVDGLLSDALRICSAALTRHKVQIVNNAGPLPALALDSNRMLQILVNLIGNAKQACEDMEDRSPCITLDAEFEEAGKGLDLRITVSDNGEGISSQNLPKLFSHGFTTRKNGHGFGLHSCIVAAHEMGGSLTASSAGTGLGAAFVLRVPANFREGRP